MSTTGRDLTRRLRLLLALGAAATLVLFGAYRGVHDDTVPMASSSTPGILAVDTAMHAMRTANKVVSGAGATDDTTGEFHTQISVAHQSLARAASENVTGIEGRHTLQTVTGLIAVYSGFVERSGKEGDDSVLRGVYLHYAGRVLSSESDGDIMDRLKDLRAEQVKKAEGQASFPLPLRLGWSAVLVLYVALCAALVEAQWFARRRFRHSVHPPLLAATVLCLAVVAVLGWLTLGAHTAMNGTLDGLLQPKSADEIPGFAAHAEVKMENVGLWAALSNWVLIEGALLMALMVAGLWPRIAEYRFKASR
ncbi:hypothetical protein [Streptomyces sp. GQFP]|uniref:hypothetical protein n=1 Tax=Streptomyces sp. GQFP TaxID=2907545 RepID=UPI001F44AB2A|nr:hypothetical protein [Streptomyces sp. GQFP]UIX30099.1 hypothetical protein LUX31_08670 [Streptomyces sp. GQFP]